MRRLWIILGLVGLLAEGAAWSAEPSLEEEIALFKAEQEGLTVVAAARYKQSVGEAPASVTIITDREIRQYGWRTLADVFRSVRGFYVSDDRNYSYLGVRGFSRPGDFNIRVLGLLNGHTLNDDIYQAFLLGRESGIDLDIVDRIEIVRGPGSALYGTSAFFAVVNIITKDGSDLQGLRASAESGSYNTNKGILTYGRRYENGLDLLLNGSYTQSSGQTLFFPEYDDGDPAHNSGFAENSDGESVYSFFGKLDHKDFHLQGIYSDRGKEVPTAPYGTVFNAGQYETFDGRYFIDLKYNPQLTQNLGLSIRIYDDWYRFKATNPLDYPPLTMNKDYTPGRWYGGELQINWKMFEWNRVIIGAEQQFHHVLLKNYDADPFFIYLDDRERFELHSIYLQDEVRVLNRLILTAGVRYDTYQHYIARDKQHATPRASMVYEPREGSVIKLLYGQAFRVPNSYELFYCGVNFVCNPALQSETINTYEGVLEQALGPHLTGSLSAYRYDIKNLINLTALGGGLIGFKNLDRVRGAGVEAELRSKWISGIESYINDTYQVTKNRDTREDLSNSPRHLAKAGLAIPLSSEAASVGIEEQYVGTRKTVQPGEKVGAYLVANLTLTVRDLYKNLEVQSAINNLFDAKFSDPASEEHAPILRIPQNRRNFNVKISYLF
ncbi:MAG: TonB-dependent receptor [Nitrospirae bacterium]|nr:TonB-dependent receptor [Nitrospirota bacterium]